MGRDSVTINCRLVITSPKLVHEHSGCEPASISVPTGIPLLPNPLLTWQPCADLKFSRPRIMLWGYSPGTVHTALTFTSGRVTPAITVHLFGSKIDIPSCLDCVERYQDLRIVQFHA